MGVRRLSVAMRGALLLPAGAYAVHQARYLLAFGDRAGAELQDQGHGYLTVLATPVVVLIAIAFGLFLGRVARACHTGDADEPRHGLVRTWLTAAVMLAALYVAQEALEGLLASGHPDGLTGIFGSGGWIALPVAIVVGGVIATALRLGSAVLDWAARRYRGTSRRLRAAVPPARRRPVRLRSRRTPLATRAAGRAPPRVARLSI